MCLIVPLWFRVLNWILPRQLLVGGGVGRTWRWREGDAFTSCPDWIEEVSR